ncbi:MAG: glutamate-5-semialdehyde dehydrogenase [Sphaerochaeta sp.]|uniref:glutamate-5-semialdehyde dehydrogenase n=1 Tax=Sphaerochaeta sp. TaxID=1972642 RepID=UPI003D0EB7BE
MEKETLQQKIRALRQSAKHLSASTAEERNSLLIAIETGLREAFPRIKAANDEDVRISEEAGQKPALVKRLIFNEDKLEATALGLRQVAALPDPIGKVRQRRLLDDGLLLEQVSFPIGVIGMIFEARPDALVQIVSLCLKSGNGIILKGGREAFRTNTALVQCIKKQCAASPLGDEWLLLLESHGDVDQMLGMEEDIDLLIPRGSNQFVRYVMEHTSIPVLGHADGICHVYVDKDADLIKAVEIAYDAKTQYPAACNAVETLLVHADVAALFIPRMAERFKQAKVVMHGDARTAALIDCIPYQEGDWRMEYLALEINIRVVDSLMVAIDHIETYGSHHTDAIVSENQDAIKRFYALVDSADVFANCSTRFADGFRFGLGAEVGISTAKIHARGPVGLEGLMSTKYLVQGSGQVVATYSGGNAQSFFHEDLSLEGPSLVSGVR